MNKTDFAEMSCPVARSLARVGEWWSILILRDAFYGLTRFYEFEASLDIAPNMLSRRLNDLVKNGLLQRRPYSRKPLRYEYLLTEAGWAFRPVIWALVAWGNAYFSPEGPASILINRQTGAPAEPVLVDAVTGQRMSPTDYRLGPGPAASEQMRYRMDFQWLKHASGDENFRFAPPAKRLPGEAQ
ncbi:winged helix-turn-helix transcriptional regulator [Martelella alba]|uniref:Helix-turn-helix transcriptional regulator n=1 Tax=Martelella alba TaxID=2590451 RepID=A0ABY2SPZ8_9HYPH|nr:helix-turn-helix domain-containing protein [Martelella alba]TKI08025.1 helix-turn-helix transcriptional regulator [Martelella alba]